MKTFKFAVMAILAVCAMTFTSCSDDDDDNNISNTENLYGIWDTTHAEGWEKEDGEITDKWNEDINSSNYDEDSERIEFTENKMYMYDWTGSKWQKDSYAYLYTLKGNSIYISNYDDGETPNITIKSLSKNELILEVQIKEKEDGVTYEFYNKLTYTKVE